MNYKIACLHCGQTIFLFHSSSEFAITKPDKMDLQSVEINEAITIR